MFSAFSNPCLNALKVASLKSPPSVCLLWALPVNNVILTSVSGEPVKIPWCSLSKIWLRIKFWFPVVKWSVWHLFLNTIPDPRLAFSIIKCTSA